ncbi:Lipid A export ATP-binding/permease protein MsbA [Planctomycetes bacterium Pla163]|uniref:Lipid A export ATP-binding/permease protein MsbA n=1 Tax=Rohdeia mirabilis TaxID=2528008 RepID=A0A518CXY7_9BACT|nr:Lipid A export ATP-binding/permease protein MsbA [Planctomycetes bacterium Pla163]
MQSSFKSFLRLLAPHAAPRIPALLVVVLLGTFASIGVVAALMLIEPLWGTLFPGAQIPGADVAGAVTGDAARGIAEGGANFADRVRASVDGLVVDLARSFSDVAPGEPPTRSGMLAAAASILAALGVITGFAQFGFVMLSRWVAFRMVIDLRLRLVRHLMGLSMRYHGRRSFGDVLSRISQDVQQTLFAIDVALKDLVQEPAQALAFLVVAILHAPTGMGIVILPVLLVVALPVVILSKKVRKRSRNSLTELGASVQALSQMFIGIRTVKAFRAEERELDAYERQNERYLRTSMRMVKTIATTRGLTAGFSLAGFAVILVALGFAVDPAASEDTMAGLTIFIVSIAQVYTKMKRTTNTVTRLQEAMGASQRLVEILGEEADVPDPAKPRPLERGLRDRLRLEDVSFSYVADDGPALEGLNLAVAAGETLALVGPSGSGKSTFMDLVARFIDPSSGRITVDGVDLREVSLDDWTRTYAMVDQAPFLFHTTIRENLRYARQDATDAQIEDAARAANIHDFIQSLPNGYDTDVEDGGARLSGGQRQRLAIARALLKEAPLLLLDEATSALDSESERSVQDALDRLMQGRTAIVIAHRLSTIRGADRIAVLEDGHLVELGTHDELLAREGTYARLHALQTSAS